MSVRSLETENKRLIAERDEARKLAEHYARRIAEAAGALEEKIMAALWNNGIGAIVQQGRLPWEEK